MLRAIPSAVVLDNMQLTVLKTQMIWSTFQKPELIYGRKPNQTVAKKLGSDFICIFLPLHVHTYLLLCIIQVQYLDVRASGVHTV